MEYILTTENLTKIYGQHKAADHINIHIKKGEVYGLIGRNGAGKTTILKMICGLSTPTSGSYTFMGKSGAELSKFKNKIGSLIETPGLFPRMTAFQNVKLKCLSMGINDNNYVNSLLEQEIMPADILPCSATMNRVTFGLNPRVELRMRDGSSQQIPAEALSDYVTKLTKEKERILALKIGQTTVSVDDLNAIFNEDEEDEWY